MATQFSHSIIYAASVAIVLSTMPSCNAKDSVEDAKVFVRGFYVWYTSAYTRNPEGCIGESIHQAGFPFDVNLSNLIEMDRKAQKDSPGIIVGIDFDPFFNSQDPFDSYAVGDAIRKDDQIWINVHGVEAGKTNEFPDLVVICKFENDRIYFFDIFYPNKQKLLSTILSVNLGKNAGIKSLSR